MPMGVISTTMTESHLALIVWRHGRDLQLKAQFDAVPRAAPLVLMLKLLISVGYSHGTPCHPIPKKT